MEKLTRSRRAISPVISTLLLILLAVAAGVIAYSYVIGWLGSATKSPKATYGEMQFDSIYATSSDKKIRLYVRNVGGIDLILTDSSIYVDGVKYANTTAITTHDLDANEVAYLECTLSSMDKHKFYEVTIVAQDGTSVSQAVRAK